MLGFTQRTNSASPLPQKAAQFFEQLRDRISGPVYRHDAPRAPKTFGVYLGDFTTPPTAAQGQLLSRWDITVLDPLKDGVSQAISSQSTNSFFLGRLNVAAIVGSKLSTPKSSKPTVTESLNLVIEVFNVSFRDNKFPGILLADWEDHFSPAVCNELIKYLHDVGFAVYLEISPPRFIAVEHARDYDMITVSGLVCRNGTILPSGMQRDAFMMNAMRPALRALAAHASISTSTVMMWDSVDNDVPLQHSVIKRSFDWCRFNSAISWIGPKAALYDADTASVTTIPGECLGAMMWLKNEAVISAHDFWRLNDRISPISSGNDILYASLSSLLPILHRKLAILPAPPAQSVETSVVNSDESDPRKREQLRHMNPLLFSATGQDFTGLGCFQIGLDCSEKDFDDLVEAQHRLKKLNLLKQLSTKELTSVLTDFQQLLEAPRTWTHERSIHIAVKELVELLMRAEDGTHDLLQVHVCLHSGLRTNLNNQFWGIYERDSDSGAIHIYLSAKTTDIAGAILHTFLSSRGFNRAQCFIAEAALSQHTLRVSNEWQLPSRVLEDLELITPSEIILFLQRLVRSKGQDCRTLAESLKAYCKYQLMVRPSLLQLRAQNSAAYLRGEITPEELVQTRLKWYEAQGCQTPDLTCAIDVFRQIDQLIPELLMDARAESVAKLEEVLYKVLQKGRVDASADLFALSMFCAFRKLAISEVYLEVLDRNPLPNAAASSDQAACFAEMFALGSRCESYFDVTPNVMGRILQDRYRDYYRIFQPPPPDDASTEIPSAYASKLIDLDPEGRPEEEPVYYRITFLSIFAVPALVDIILLTTTGRGLYLTTYMGDIDKRMATTALFISLFLTGFFGTWIAQGGSYYLHSMAFPAMNMFVITRFVAGMAVVLAGGILSLILIGVTEGFYAGAVFFCYLLFLTTYLILLATLAIYQLPGFMFQSGRLTIVACLPILLLSPIITLWIQNDLTVYLCVIAGFLISLILGARRVISAWSTWYLRIVSITDQEVVSWYTNYRQRTNAETGLEKTDIDIATTPVPRTALLAEVLKEYNRRPWSKSTADETVKTLASNYAATMFLMVWYCKYSRTRMPYRYSATWNLQCKAAIDTLKDMQKGLKLHNAFIHWRHGGDEVWVGVLYFIVALLDKWVALISNQPIVGLSAANSDLFRLAVGFGLAYYLVAAVFLDAIANPLWATANKKVARHIGSLKDLERVEREDAAARRSFYWSNLAKFFFLHIWGLAITSALLWTFESSPSATIMYIAYVGSYTGLLWYQYNRIFGGWDVLPDLAIGAILGLIVGPILHAAMPDFAYSSVIALGLGTWTVCLLSLRTAKIGWPRFKKQKSQKPPLPVSYSCSSLGPNAEPTQAIMAEIYESVCALPDEMRYRLDPLQHPGTEVIQHLSRNDDTGISSVLRAAFPTGKTITQRATDSWRDGETVVELLAARDFVRQADKLRTLSRREGDQIHLFVFVGLDIVDNEYVMDVRRNCKVIAEAIIYATAAVRFGYSTEHSVLAEMLATSNEPDEELSIPQGIQRQLEHSAQDRKKIISFTDKALLRHLMLGLDCDTEWDSLPEEIRKFLLSRCFLQRSYLSRGQKDWIRARFCQHADFEVDEYIARCNLGVAFTTLVTEHASMLDAQSSDDGLFDHSVALESEFQKFVAAETMPQDAPRRLLDTLWAPFVRIHQILVTMMKFVVVTIVADPEFQRELDYTLAGSPSFFRWPVTIILSGMWSYCKVLQQILIPMVLLRGRKKVIEVRTNMKGIKTVMEKKKVTIGSLTGPSTCFFQPASNGNIDMYQYAGSHQTQPEGRAGLVAINSYNSSLILQRKEEYTNGALANRFVYEYPRDNKSRLPIQRRCVQGQLVGQLMNYDQRGYITSGSYMKDDNFVEFSWFYRSNAKFDDELLRGEFTLPHIRMSVSWSVPPPDDPKKMDRWIPNQRIMEATFIEDTTIWQAKWVYEHKHHPLISTTRNGAPCATPDMIQYDWFGILQKPKNCSFLNDNPIFSFTSTSTNIFSRLFGFNTRWYAISTARARTYLWDSWKKGKDLDAVTARWLDETAMRSDRFLRPYWSARDSGRLQTAEAYIDEHVDTIMARTDIDPSISAWTNAAYRISDLYSFGQGGDCTITTRTVSSQLQDSEKELHVLAMDTGTWPMEGGGVSACRRDMVNDLHTIRWHVVAESANDYGVPKFQIERNVQSLSVLPLWGLDHLTPSHGVFENYLDSAVQRRLNATLERDIEQNFFPILTALVKCARAINVTQEHIQEGTKALVELNQYFQSSRHWSGTWLHPVTKQKWRELWLSDDVGDNCRPYSAWLEAEHPTLLHLDQALDMWHRYLFILSTPVPEKIPDVFQASHHFTGASYGVLCKVLRGCTLHVWDHCISWREVTVFLSSAMSWDPPFVCHSLMCLSRIAGFLILHHADVVLPCADFFNPGWEIEIGSQEGTVAHRRTIARKIDPVVNGICNMDSFKPIEKIRSQKPTVVMLSHVRFVKDIKNAILAADIIVNEWGIKDYQLDVFGDMERAPTYAVECQEIIAAKSLGDYVCLRGLGSPSKVLETGWVFLNSSISEGLPLAMGEAALTGVPVVCTDVGASFRVVTDPATGKKFSAVVAPNDASSLARAQINVMGLMDEWAEFSGDDTSAPGYTIPKISLKPTPEEAKFITERMYAKQEQRRALGMRGRANVLSNFTADRYLREHEQMLWIGKLQNMRKQAANKRLSAASYSSSSDFDVTPSGNNRESRLLTPTQELEAFQTSSASNSPHNSFQLTTIKDNKKRPAFKHFSFMSSSSAETARSVSPSSFRSNYLMQSRRGTVHRSFARDMPPPPPTLGKKERLMAAKKETQRMMGWTNMLTQGPQSAGQQPYGRIIEEVEEDFDAFPIMPLLQRHVRQSSGLRTVQLAAPETPRYCDCSGLSSDVTSEPRR